MEKKSLEEILSAIEGDDIKEAIVGLIDNEREVGISKYNSKDKEVLKYKNAMKSLGFDKDKYETIDDFIESKQDVEKKVTKSNLTIAELNDRLNTITDELNAERENVQAKAKESRDNKLTAELTQAIGGKYIGSEYMIRDLIREGQVDINDNKVVFKNGDDLIPFETGLKQLEEQNADMLKTSLKGGTGDVGGKTPKQKDTSFVDKMKMYSNSKI